MAGQRIRGNFGQNRKLLLATLSDYSVLFIGPSKSGKTLMGTVLEKYPWVKWSEMRLCPCGDMETLLKPCSKCSPEAIEEKKKVIGRLYSKYDIIIPTISVNRMDEFEYFWTESDLYEEFISGSDYYQYDRFDISQPSLSMIKGVLEEFPKEKFDNHDEKVIGRLSFTIAIADKSKRVSTLNIREAVSLRRYPGIPPEPENFNTPPKTEDCLPNRDEKPKRRLISLRR